jgi:hypothetical protein
MGDACGQRMGRRRSRSDARLCKLSTQAEHASYCTSLSSSWSTRHGWQASWPSDLWPHRNPHKGRPAEIRRRRPPRGPFSFKHAVPIFAACAMPWSVIKQSRVQSAAGCRSSDFGHFVLAGVPISTSAVGSLAATRWRPTRRTGLTLPSPRTTDRWVVVDSRVKNRQSQGITGPYALFARHQGSSLAHSAHLCASPRRPVVGFAVASG